VEQKDLFPSTLRRSLSGDSPVAFAFGDLDPKSQELSRERTPEGRSIADEEYWEGLCFYRPSRYTFVYGEPEPGLGSWPEYGVKRINSARLDLWSLKDHPELVLDVLAMNRSLHPGIPEERVEWLLESGAASRWYRVDPHEMRTFLTTYGPLTPSYVWPEGRTPDAMIDELGMYIPDDRTKRFAYNFSEPVSILHLVAQAGKEDHLTGIATCLGQIELSPPRTLYRALLLQLLDHFLSGNPLRPCEGCGRWFVFTEDSSQARHREGWKRRDARYHSRACLKRTSERRRRAKMREQHARRAPAS
jgi:hypothetical protein